MSIFDGYNNPGPGVYVNEQREGPVIRFFRILGTRLMTLILCNLMFLAVNIPTIVITYAVAVNVMPVISQNLNPEAFAGSIENLGKETGLTESIIEISDEAFRLYFVFILVVSFLIVGMTLIVNGPFQSAFSFIYRNYARETSGFFWHDYRKALKTNWKQSIKVSIITFLVTAVLLFNIGYYATRPEGTLPRIMLGLFVAITVLFSCFQIYIYPLIVTMDLPLKGIFKNAAIFLALRLFPNLGVLLLQVLIMFVIPFALIFFGGQIGSTIAVVLYITIVFSLSLFIGSFFVWQLIEMYIIPDEEEGQTEETPASTEVEMGAVETLSEK